MAQRILLIQDDAVAAAAILDALSDSGDGCFEVERLRSCSPVLNQLDGVAAILVDLNLPDTRGLETFDRLFRAAPRIPILVLTDPQDEKTAKLAVQGGAQDYLFKARLDAYLLPKAVASMIERAANAEALFDVDQGYYFSRPVPAGKFGHLLRRGIAATAAHLPSSKTING